MRKLNKWDVINVTLMMIIGVSEDTLHKYDKVLEEIIMRCKCGKQMEIVDQDPDLGTMYECNECGRVFIDKGPGNAFDSHGWQ